MIWILIAAAVFFLDYYVKKRAEEELKDGKKREIGKSGFSLKLVHNRGFALNRLENKPVLVKRIHGILVALMAVYGILCVFFEKGKELTSLGYALILGGGFSNYYDRVKKGYVTDYLGLPIFRKLLFNLSDLMIFSGGILLLLGEWKNR